MGKYDYYLHKSRGYFDDYFGIPGRPFKVSRLRYCLAGLLDYKRTRVRRGTPLRRVVIRSVLATGAHRRSWIMNALLREYVPKQKSEGGTLCQQ